MKVISNPQGKTLAQTLAVQSQIHLSGTVGRILKQIRDIEQIAPIFVETEMVRSIDRPNPLNLRVAGIATKFATLPTMGGHLYASAATRVDIAIENNAISSFGQDNTCEIDDIEYENLSKRLQLIGVRQAYEMADSALRSSERYDLILLDCPLVLNRSMVPLKEDAAYAGHRAAYNKTIGVISKFWETHQNKLFPWNPNGTVVVGVATERYGAIVHISQQDLRTDKGRQHLLSTEKVDVNRLRTLIGSENIIASIGEKRFVFGLLNNCYTRTAAFRMNIQAPEMEPTDVVKMGVIGLHFKSSDTTGPILLQFIGNEPLWTRQNLDHIVGQIMAITVIGGLQAAPIPIQLAAKEQQALDNFIKYYDLSVRAEIKRNEIGNIWLSNFGELS